MKTNIYIFSAAIAALCLVSCSKAEPINDEGKLPTGNVIVFTADSGTGADIDESKTYITTPKEDGTYVIRWSSSASYEERIVVNGVKSNLAVIQDGSYNTKANFSVEMEPADFYCAINPSNLYSSFDAASKTMDVFVKADANYKTSDKDGKVITYDPTTSLVAAYSTNTTLTFKHMMAYYKLVVNGGESYADAKIARVVVRQNGDAPNIAGVYTLTFGEDGISMEPKTLNKLISYFCPADGLAMGTEMLIGLPALNYADGLIFTVYCKDGSFHSFAVPAVDLSQSAGKVISKTVNYNPQSGVIRTAADWEAFAAAFNAASRADKPDSTALYRWVGNGTVKLGADIEAETFTRLNGRFDYIFDGDDHCITAAAGKNALFYSVGSKGVIKNLVTDGEFVDGNVDDGIAVVCNNFYGTMENCTNNAAITVSKAMHMAVAPFAKIVNSGIIKGCVNNGNITVTCDATAADRNVYVGGIAARVLSSGSGDYSSPAVHLLNCTNNAAITVDIDNAGGKKVGYAGFGGIVGWVARDRSKYPVIKFEGCVNTGGISVHNTYDGSGSDFASSVGGIAGLCWGDYYTDASQTETYHLGVTGKTHNQNKVFFLNCTNSGKLENNTVSYCSTQKLWGKSYTGGIAGSVYCFESVFSQEPVFDGCVSTGDVVPYSLTDSDRPSLESVAGGILGIGSNVTFKNCTVTATVGTTQRTAFAIAGVMGIAAGKFTVDNCSIYPHLVMGRSFYTAQNNWGLIATYPVRGNTSRSFPSGKTADNALTAVKILFSGGALPSLKESAVSNCQLGAEWIKINANDVAWNTTTPPTLAQITTKFNSLENCQTNGVQGNNLKLNAAKTQFDIDAAYNGKTSGDVTFSGNTLLTSPPAVNTAVPASMVPTADNTYNF